MFFPFSIIAVKIDKDKDGFITEEELTEWIKHVEHRYTCTCTLRQWTLFQWGSKVSTNWSNTWKHARYCVLMHHTVPD